MVGTLQRFIGAEDDSVFGQETLDKLQEFRDTYGIESNVVSVTQEDVNMMNALQSAITLDEQNHDIEYSNADFASVATSQAWNQSIRNNDPLGI